MIKKILLSLLFIVVLLLLYFGYDYIKVENIGFVILCAGFALLADTIYEIRKTSQKENIAEYAITIFISIMFVGLFIAFGFIFISLG